MSLRLEEHAEDCALREAFDLEPTCTCEYRVRKACRAERKACVDFLRRWAREYRDLASAALAGSVNHEPVAAQWRALASRYDAAATAIENKRHLP